MTWIDHVQEAFDVSQQSGEKFLIDSGWELIERGKWWYMQGDSEPRFENVWRGPGGYKGKHSHDSLGDWWDPIE